MPRKYSGSRKMKDERIALFQSVLGTMSMYLTDSSNPEQDDTPSLSVLFSSGPRITPFTALLTSFTEEELDSFEEFMELAIKIARPIVLARDRLAKEALEIGDDSFNRSYRQPPLFVVRPRRKKHETERLFNAIIEMLCAHPRAIVDQNKFTNRRTEMDFWDIPDDELKMPESPI